MRFIHGKGWHDPHYFSFICREGQVSITLGPLMFFANSRLIVLGAGWQYFHYWGVAK